MSAAPSDPAADEVGMPQFFIISGSHFDPPEPDEEYYGEVFDTADEYGVCLVQLYYSNGVQGTTLDFPLEDAGLTTPVSKEQFLSIFVQNGPAGVAGHAASQSGKKRTRGVTTHSAASAAADDNYAPHPETKYVQPEKPDKMGPMIVSAPASVAESDRKLVSCIDDAHPCEMQTKAKGLDTMHLLKHAWSRMVPDELLEWQAQQINDYASHRGKLNAGVHTGPVTVMELQVFMGVLLRMPLRNIRVSRRAWSCLDRFNDRLIKNSMPRARFEFISRHIHFYDAAVRPARGAPGHRTFPVEEFVQKMPPLFMAEMDIPDVITIDEAVNPYKGHIGFRCNIMRKPHGKGIEFYVAADTRGYVLNWIMHAGSDTLVAGDTPATMSSTVRSTDLQKHSRLREQAILQLLKPFKTEKGYPAVVCDRGFMSPHLVYILYSNDIKVCGPVRLSWLPGALADAASDCATWPKYKWESSTISDGDTTVGTVSIISDSKPVYIVSTVHVDVCSVGILTRLSEDGEPVDHVMPIPQVFYNKFTHGVDLSDQVRQEYTIRRHWPRWYCALYSFVIDTVVSNVLRVVSAARARRHLSLWTKYDVQEHLSFWLISQHEQPAAVHAAAAATDVTHMAVYPHRSPQWNTYHQQQLAQARQHVRDGGVCQPGLSSTHESSRCCNPLCTHRTRVMCECCQVHVCPGHCWRVWHSFVQTAE